MKTVMLSFVVLFTLASCSKSIPLTTLPDPVEPPSRDTVVVTPPATPKEYLDLNEFGLKGDNSNESALFTKALQLASEKNLTITGKGVFNLNGARIAVPDGISIESKNPHDLIIRNGAYIFSSGNIRLQQVDFQDFSTAVFYYPKGHEPKGDLTIDVRNCDFENCMSAFSTAGSSRSTVLKNSFFIGNRFINSGTSAINLKFSHINLTFEKNHFEGLMFGGKKLAYLVITGLDSTGGGTGFQFHKNVIKNIVHPGNDANYTVLSRGIKNYIADNEVENVSHVAFYIRGDSSIIERNHITNITTDSKYAIIAKSGTGGNGFFIAESNFIKGNFSTGLYIDAHFETTFIRQNDIRLVYNYDTMGYAGIRVIGHHVFKQFNIEENVISIDMQNPKAACIRLNGVGFDVVKISDNKMKSNTRILLTGQNDIRNLEIIHNKLISKTASPIGADNISIINNSIDYPGSVALSFIIQGNNKMKMEGNDNTTLEEIF
jgi:hypothetical protein